MGKKFRLQAVLDYQKVVEELGKRELAEIQGFLSRDEGRLQTLLSEKALTLKNLGHHQAGEVRLNEINLCHRFLEKIDKDIAIQEEHLKVVKNEYEEKRTEVIQLTKKKRQMELIKDGHIHTEKQKLKKQEQLLSDELSKKPYFSLEGDGKAES